MNTLVAEAIDVVVRAGLEDASEALRARGVPVPTMDGKLLRPLLAYAMVPPTLRTQLGGGFWSGALAVQMVHEASLLHDDILDDAGERRGQETVVARNGVAHALVLGDHYLTGAYRAAAAAGAPDFLDAFIIAVERTVAGEVAQCKATGRAMAMDEYTDMVAGKSGELIGAAACLGGALFGLDGHARRIELGRQLGSLYQQVDDLLDYCPAAVTGKPPLQDYRQKKWTWVLGLAGVEDFDLDKESVLARIFYPAGAAPSPARAALSALRLRRDELVQRIAALSPGDELVARVLDGWVAAAEAGVAAQEEAGPVGPSKSLPSVESDVVDMARAVGGPERWPAYFGHHAKTFRFAARLFPAAPAAKVSGVYAYCRFTDDMVDDPADGAPLEVLKARLECWAQLTREAFEGHPTGVPLLDVVIGEAGIAGVSWRYPDALLAGVGMDLTRVRYADWAALEEYTFGVAAAVGGWITQLFGMHDPALLDQAHALGHGMQLTNIARDVGEDWDRGRLYLPQRFLQQYGLDERDVARMKQSEGPLPRVYAEVTEALLQRADAYYEQAWPGIQALPGWYRRPVAVAAQAYRGIHDQVRRNDYDNLRLRARTTGPAKVLMAVRGLVRSYA